MRTLIRMLFLVSISLNASARTEMMLPERKVEPISPLSTVSALFSPKYIDRSEYEGGSVVLNVSTGVKGSEVTGARVKLYSGDYFITEFGVSVITIRPKSGLKEEFIEIRINKSVVTSMVVKLYTDGALDYSFTLPIDF